MKNELTLTGFGPTIWGERNSPNKRYKVVIVPMSAQSGVPHGCRIDLGKSAQTLFLTEADRARLGALPSYWKDARTYLLQAKVTSAGPTPWTRSRQRTGGEQASKRTTGRVISVPLATIRRLN